MQKKIFRLFCILCNQSGSVFFFIQQRCLNVYAQFRMRLWRKKKRQNMLDAARVSICIYDLIVNSDVLSCSQ